MARPVRSLLLVGGLTALSVVGGCRTDTVTLALDPAPGDVQRYRYEVAVDITRRLDGAEPETTEIESVVEVTQTITAVGPDGTTADVTLRSDGGPARTAVVRLDQAGLLSGVELIEGQQLDVFGLESAARMVPPIPMPTAAVAPGDTWRLSVGPVSSRARLVRLGVIDGTDTAVVDAHLEETVDEVRPAGDTTAAVLGTIISSSTVAFDLRDGLPRRIDSTTEGRLDATFAAPPGVTSPPVAGEIRYSVSVRAVRID